MKKEKVIVDGETWDQVVRPLLEKRKKEIQLALAKIELLKEADEKGWWRLTQAEFSLYNEWSCELLQMNLLNQNLLTE